MIDNLALGLTHFLMLVAAFILVRRPELDREAGPRDASPRPSRAKRRDA